MWNKMALAGGIAAAALLAAPMTAWAGYGDDRAEIETLQGKYMFAMDWKDADAYAATFTEDGVLDYAGGIAKGRAAIKAEIEKMRARDAERNAKLPPGKVAPRTRHNITDMVVEIKGDTAIAKAYWFSITNADVEKNSVVNGYGHYEDALKKVNGHWLFTKRKIFNELLKGREAPATPIPPR